MSPELLNIGNWRSMYSRLRPLGLQNFRDWWLWLPSFFPQFLSNQIVLFLLHFISLFMFLLRLRFRPFFHYYIPSYAPLTSNSNKPLRKITVSELIRQIFQKNILMCECEPTIDGERNVDEVAGRTFAQAALFRGDMCTYTVDEAMTFVKPEEIVMFFLLNKKIENISFFFVICQQKVICKVNQIFKGPPCFFKNSELSNLWICYSEHE